MAALLLVCPAMMAKASDYAVEVLSYDPDADGIGYDSINSAYWFDDPTAALGRPTVDTTGDIFSTGPATRAVPVVPVYQPFRYFEVVTIGKGSQLTLKFDHPVEDDTLNPCGIDFIVFGNTNMKVAGKSQWQNGDPNLFTLTGTVVAPEPAKVSVSQDGITWYTFENGPYADDFPPTLGRCYDPDHYETSLWNNLWWGEPTDPTYPIDPRLTASSFTGQTVAQMAIKYGWSAGGTGFDLADLPDLPPPEPPHQHRWIQYVRISNPINSEVTPEIDAVADVRPRVLPDLDCDSDVDEQDMEIFLACMTGPGMGPPRPDCERADFDQDGDIDMDEFAILQRCLSGSGIRMNPACMQP
ncbi:MAG: hypothetical protein FWC56_05555 [Phycisphaerae bacterium]|nr:hypothetical protein [Phycisphaerae bacterium]